MVIFAFEKFRSYLIGTNVIIFSNYNALGYLLMKKCSEPSFVIRILLLLELYLEIKDKKESENMVLNHLSRLIQEKEAHPLNEHFIDE